ncbi:MAG TPA: 2-hydroxyglutaryl-CoA dehydratase, partial [Kofleriaceae bacterium]|nr:2-hydroxyglutaryl-CoA dehydratase [Kofleriaceae bacterium]
MEEVRAYLAKHPDLASAFHRSPHVGGATTTDLVYEVGSRRKRFTHLKGRIAKVFNAGAERKAAHQSLIAKARAAAAKANARKAVATAPEQPADAVDGQVAVPAGKKSLRVLAN